jgi:hypothetical protein
MGKDGTGSGSGIFQTTLSAVSWREKRKERQNKLFLWLSVKVSRIWLWCLPILSEAEQP